MPIYEYECQSCQRHFEVVQKFSEKALKKCNSCGGKLQKLISQSSFHLKGSGWYVTDYVRKDRKDGESKAPKAPKPSDAPASAKTETKRETAGSKD